MNMSWLVKILPISQRKRGRGGGAGRAGLFYVLINTEQGTNCNLYIPVIYLTAAWGLLGHGEKHRGYYIPAAMIR